MTTYFLHQPPALFLWCVCAKKRPLISFPARLIIHQGREREKGLLLVVTNLLHLTFLTDNIDGGICEIATLEKCREKANDEIGTNKQTKKV